MYWGNAQFLQENANALDYYLSSHLVLRFIYHNFVALVVP